MKSPFLQLRRLTRKQSSTSPGQIIRSGRGNAMLSITLYPHNHLIESPLAFEITPRQTIPCTVSTRRNTSAKGSAGVSGKTYGKMG